MPYSITKSAPPLISHMCTLTINRLHNVYRKTFPNQKQNACESTLASKIIYMFVVHRNFSSDIISLFPILGCHCSCINLSVINISNPHYFFNPVPLSARCS